MRFLSGDGTRKKDDRRTPQNFHKEKKILKREQVPEMKIGEFMTVTTPSITVRLPVTLSSEFLLMILPPVFTVIFEEMR